MLVRTASTSFLSLELRAGSQRPFLHHIGCELVKNYHTALCGGGIRIKLSTSNSGRWSTTAMVSSDKNARDGSARSFAIPTVANGVAVARLPRASGRPRDLA